MSTNKKINQSLQNFRLEKPNLKEIDRSVVFEKLDKIGDKFNTFLHEINEPKYLYWDTIKYKQSPEGLDIKESWFLARQFRNLISMPTPIVTEEGPMFKWIKLSRVDEFLHKIDVSSGGQVFASVETLSGANKQKFLSRGILEEAIASSQLEGAHTTRTAAKLMITNKREPANKDEQMVLNNYKTILKIDEDFKDKKMSEDLIFELHRMLTDKTIEEGDVGRYRRDEDNIVVEGQIGNERYVTHNPPSEKFVKEQMERLINYANDSNDEVFVHPIIKAIFLHFWIGYLHPFVDGNGRLARALFYWYLLRNNYWTFMYLPISLIIKRAPTQYGMSYIYSEQDNFDVTYFFDFHIRKIIQSLEDFDQYVTRKMQENREIDRIISENIKLSDRQKFLLHHLISEKNANTTATSYSTINNISRQTAAKDIEELVKLGFVTGSRDGKYVKYTATQKLIKLI